MPSTGFKEAKIQAEWIQEQCKDMNFDKVKFYDYDVLLSFPKKPGKTSMYDREGDLVQNLEIDREPIRNGDSKDPRTLLPFNAYSPCGTVEVKIFEYLDSKFGSTFIKHRNQRFWQGLLKY